jgi:hypothetical protein
VAETLGVGPVHDALVHLLELVPEWLLALLQHHGRLPAGLEFRLERTEGATTRSGGRVVEVRADLVLRLSQPDTPASAETRIGLLVEVQLRHDDDRITSWEGFHVTFRKRLGRHLLLVVLTLDERLARELDEELQMRIFHVRTFVLGPGRIPRIDTPNPIDLPEVALLNAMFHVRGHEDLPLLVAALLALQQFPDDLRTLFRTMLLSHFEESLIMEARAQLEDTSDPWPGYEPSDRERRSYLYVRGQRQGVQEGRQEGRQKGRQEGRQEGRAQSILDLLRLRGLTPSAALEATVRACGDLQQLERWFARALTIDDPDELLR